MIVKFKGYVDFCGDEFIDIDVKGVIYRVLITKKNIDIIQKKDSLIDLHTYEILKENERLFFGFLEKEEREVFSDLLTVQGVGGKMALNIMNHLNCEEIYSSITQENENFFCTVSGVGNKLAKRIINELKEKIKKKSDKNKLLNLSSSKSDFSDLVSCLFNLGYPQNISEKIAVKVLADNKNTELDKLIPIALKYLSKPNIEKDKNNG